MPDDLYSRHPTCRLPGRGTKATYWNYKPNCSKPVPWGGLAVSGVNVQYNCHFGPHVRENERKAGTPPHFVYPGIVKMCRKGVGRATRPSQ